MGPGGGRAVPGRGRRGSAGVRGPRAAWLSGLCSGRLTPPSEDEGTDGEAGDPCCLGSEPVDRERESDRHGGANDSGARPDGPARPVRLPTSRHRWWSIPMVAVAFVACIAIGVAGLLPAELVADEVNERDRRGPADAVRTRAVVGATGRRADHVRRARGSRRAVSAVGQLLLRHRHRTVADDPVVARRSRRAGCRVPHRGGEVRLPDAAAAPHVRPRVDADLRAGRAVRGA